MRRLASPLGELGLEATARGLCFLGFADRDPRTRIPAALARRLDFDSGAPVLDEAAAQLDAYFRGRRRAFDLPLDLCGTPFQLRVWRALLAIPCGEVRTYGELARDLGNPALARAVGAANGANPVSIIVPCHRLLGGAGALTGYGGGLEAKAFLLRLERGGA